MLIKLICIVLYNVESTPSCMYKSQEIEKAAQLHNIQGVRLGYKTMELSRALTLQLSKDQKLLEKPLVAISNTTCTQCFDTAKMHIMLDFCNFMMHTMDHDMNGTKCGI